VPPAGRVAAAARVGDRVDLAGFVGNADAAVAGIRVRVMGC
jgi:hypothetical protein